MAQGMRFPPPPLMDAQPPGAFQEMQALAGGPSSMESPTAKVAEAGRLLMAAAQQQAEQGDPSWISTITPMLRALTEMTSASMESRPPGGEPPPEMGGGPGMPPGLQTSAIGANAPLPPMGVPSGGAPGLPMR